MDVRYLAAIFTGAALGMEGDGAEVEASLPQSFQLVFDHRGIRVFSDRPAACLTCPSAIVIGEIFARGRQAPCETLSEGEWGIIARSKGQRLIEAYWGSYIALVANRDGAIGLRAPFGDLGCYYTTAGNTLLVASDLTLLLAAAKIGRRVDVPALARHIAYPEWRSHQTCLHDVLELRGGDCLHIEASGIARQSTWSPWRFVGNDMQIGDPEDAVRRVGDAVRVSVAARVRDKKCLLLLSGGLDSAVVAAVMGMSGVDFGSLNIVAGDTASDEWSYAKLVAQTFGGDLELRRFDLATVDVRRSGAADIPYPVHRCFIQALDHIAAEVAQRQQAELIVDGGGGDNVFFGSRSVSILADCLLTSGFDQRFWTASRTLGELAQTGMATLLRKTIVRCWRHRRSPRLAPSTAFLSDEAKAAVAAAPPHPWFVPPSDVLPGRASHVALLVPAQNLVEAYQAQAAFPSMSPLVSQPVIETCLRVPSWLWIAPGRNRAAARSAFADCLPAQVIDRRSKGAPTSFVAAIFEHNRKTIREMLLGGALAAAGLLDQTTVAQALGPGPIRDLRFVRIMELLDAEAWARAQA